MIPFSGATHGTTDIQPLDCSLDVQSLNVCFHLYFPCREFQLQNDMWSDGSQFQDTQEEIVISIMCTHPAHHLQHH